MRISELAEHTGVSVPTLKYYLREGLLPAGESRGATRASYDEGHVSRVRLVRALVTVGGLAIEQVREVVHALDQPPGTRHELLGTAHRVLGPSRPRDGEPSAPTDDPLVAGLGWPVQADSAASRQVVAALGNARAAGWEVGPESFAAWAEAALVQARTDVRPALAEIPAAEALEFAILGTVLTDPVILALRRLAQEAVSAERLASPQ